MAGGGAEPSERPTNCARHRNTPVYAADVSRSFPLLHPPGSHSLRGKQAGDGWKRQPGLGRARAQSVGRSSERRAGREGRSCRVVGFQSFPPGLLSPPYPLSLLIDRSTDLQQLDDSTRRDATRESTIPFAPRPTLGPRRRKAKQRTRQTSLPVRRPVVALPTTRPPLKERRPSTGPRARPYRLASLRFARAKQVVTSHVGRCRHRRRRRRRRRRR